jgi:hypothetical protein
MAGEVEDSLSTQTNLPAIDLGALIFYSGNILIDLLLNFAFAIPEIIALLIHSLMSMFSLEVQIFGLMTILFYLLFMIFYILGIIQFLTGIRSGRIT